MFQERRRLSFFSKMAIHPGLHIVISILILLMPGPVWAADEKLLSQLKAYVAAESEKLGSGVKVGILVQNVANDEKVFAENEEEFLIPASVQKLLLTLTSLRVLGGNYHFPTEVFVDNLPKSIDPEEKERVDFRQPVTSVGSLYLRGYGDPSMDSLRLLDIAHAIRQHGVTSVQDVVLDSTLLLSPKRNIGPKPSEAGTNALSINQNAFAIYVAPSRAANSAFVSATPGLTFRIVNQVLCIRGREQSISIDTKMRGEQSSTREEVRAALAGESEEPQVQVNVRGTMGIDAPALVLWQALPDIPRAYSEIFSYSLKQAGVEVKGNVRFSDVPPNAALLETFHSKSLSEILREMNQQSSNVIAEQVLYALGQDDKGYFQSSRGLKRLVQQLELLTPRTAENLKMLTEQVRDASGFDRRNRLSAQQVVGILLDAVRDQAIAPDFVSSLGKFSEVGTLRPRALLTEALIKDLRGEELKQAKNRARSVWAKTGTLEGVSSLAGVAVTKTGEKLAFALLLNDVKDKASASAFEDGFIQSLIGLRREKSEVGSPLP